MVNLKCQTIEVNGEEIFYREMGEGPVLLLIHGNMASSIFFTEMMEELSKNYRVIAPDLRGYGNSSYKKPVQKISDFAEDIKEFVIKLNLNDIYILGWSLGGGVVMEFLADEDIKYRIKKAILLSSIGVYGAELPSTMGLKNAILDPQIFNMNMTLTQSLVKYNPLTSFLEHSNENIKYNGMDGVLKNLVYTVNLPNKDIYERNLQDAAKQKSLSEAGNAVVNFRFNKEVRRDVPILIIHGSEDKVIDIIIARVNKDYFTSQAEFVTFSECGHAVMTDKYDELIAEIKIFCK